MYGALFTAYSLGGTDGVFSSLQETLVTAHSLRFEWSSAERTVARRAFVAYKDGGRGFVAHDEPGRREAVAGFLRMIRQHRFFGYQYSWAEDFHACFQMLKVRGAGRRLWFACVSQKAVGCVRSRSFCLRGFVFLWFGRVTAKGLGRQRAARPVEPALLLQVLVVRAWGAGGRLSWERLRTSRFVIRPCASAASHILQVLRRCRAPFDRDHRCEAGAARLVVSGRGAPRAAAGAGGLPRKRRCE